MKPVPLLILTLASLFSIPSPASSRSASDDYAVYPPNSIHIFSISFQGDYTWYALGQYDGAVREDTRDGSLKYFGTNDGIPDRDIYTVFTDSKGSVWFGTRNGVSRWDGSTWMYYSHDSPFQAADTYDIREDGNGVLWFATSFGVRSFDGTKWGVWKTELPAATHHVVIGRDGIRWFGTDRGIVRYNGEQWTPVGPSEKVCAVFEDSKGRVWILYFNDRAPEWSSGGHLAVIEGEEVKDAPVVITSASGAIAEAPDGSIWCGAGREFHVFDGVAWSTVPLGGDRTYQTISCVASASDGSLWFGGYFNERYRIKNGVLSYIPLETGPVWFDMLSAAVDSRGMKWFGANRGLSRFDGTHWKTFYDRDGLAGNRVNALAVSGDLLWCGTERGISRYDGAAWKTFGIADGLPDSSITCLAAASDGSEVWAGAEKGVSRYDGTSWKTYTSADGLPSDQVTALFLDERGGKVYAGTVAGAASFDGSSWTGVAASPDSVNAILVDSSRRLWIGTSRGVFRQDGSSWTRFYGGDGVSNLPDDTVTALAEDRSGGVWVGTERGSVRFDGSAWTVNLRLDKVRAIAPDSDGRIWIARNGVNMDGAVVGYTPSEASSGALKGTWTLYSNQHGATSFAFTGSDVWANGQMVARIDPLSREIRVFTNADGLPVYGISNIASADGSTVWGVAYSGMDETSWITRWDGSAWTTFKTSYGKLDRIAADQKGGIWVVLNVLKNHHGTILRWDVNTGTKTFEAYDFQCKAIHISPRDVAWFSAEALYCAPDSLWASLSSRENLVRVATPHEWKISTMVEDRNGVLWCGGKDQPFGVARFDGSTWKTYTVDDGLPSVTVNALAVDTTGAVWAATPSGAARFDGEKWLTLTPDNSGLKSEIVTTVGVAPDGTIWFGGWDWIASFDYDKGTPVAETPDHPAPLRIGSVFPNPFNASTTIRFSLPSTGRVTLAVYDVTGRKVRDLVEGSLPAGDHSVAWNGRDAFGRQVSSGVYFTRLVFGKNAASRKILFLK